MTKETWDAFLEVMEKDPNTTVIYNTPTKESEKTMKELTDVEKFAAKIADKQDNPNISMNEVEQRTKEASSKIKNSLKLKEMVTNLKKPFGRGGFGQGKPDDAMYLKDLQRNRILKKADLILDKLGDMEQIVHLLVEQLQKLKK